VAPEGFKAPYVVVLTQLREGPWLTGLLNSRDPASATMELIGKKVKLGHRVVHHMKYTAGEGVVPLFSLVDD
jgi:hypothetical protein